MAIPLLKGIGVSLKLRNDLLSFSFTGNLYVFEVESDKVKDLMDMLNKTLAMGLITHD